MGEGSASLHIELDRRGRAGIGVRYNQVVPSVLVGWDGHIEAAARGAPAGGCGAGQAKRRGGGGQLQLGKAQGGRRPAFKPRHASALLSRVPHQEACSLHRCQSRAWRAATTAHRPSAHPMHCHGPFSGATVLVVERKEMLGLSPARV